MKTVLIVCFSIIATLSFSQEDNEPTSTLEIGCISGDCDNGLGKYVWNNGDYYYGAWKLGKMEGKGTYYKSDGTIYDGFWMNNKKNGRGKLVLPN